nr:MAG TPA: hypothetical protein [Bacteriophage sp.]
MDSICELILIDSNVIQFSKAFVFMLIFFEDISIF